jgi:uncharacterized membrane protein
MNKEQILGLISSSLSNGTITKSDLKSYAEELIVPAQASAGVVSEAGTFDGKKRFTASNILYIIGGIIVLIGICTFLFNFWDDLSSAIRILLTLGIAIATYISGLLLRSNDKSVAIATIMQVIGGILTPIGISVTIHELSTIDPSAGVVFVIAISSALIYIISLTLFRSVVFSFFAIGYGTVTLYAGLAYILSQGAVQAGDSYSYLTLAIGISYIFLASFLKNTSHRGLRHTLDYFGGLGIYVSLMILGGFGSENNLILEAMGVLALCGGLYLASIDQNKTILKVTAFFIFAFIIKFTHEYFVNSLGWPLALIIGGIALIAVGFGLVRFNKNLRLP